MPENTVYVGRPTKWGNPFVVDSDWLLWAGLALGFMGDADGRRRAAVEFHRAWITGTPLRFVKVEAGGEIAFENARTRKTVLVSADEYVRGLGATFAGLYGAPTLPERPTVEELRGKSLACFCPVGHPCHADVLLELANAEID